jgi:Type I phosphodiesterase / nucleotide pyrophosphatase
MTSQHRPPAPLVAVVLAVVSVAVAARSVAPAQAPRPSVILVTLDGARAEEIFGGLDLAVLKSLLKRGETLEAHPLYVKYWAATPQSRREKLMPFFWGTLMREHGSVAGNPARRSRVHLANAHWFSYPGYSEMLVGRAHDDVIKSNDPVRNPFPTVLEFARSHGGLTRDQVAVFASWSVFNAIAEHTEGAIAINAGFEPYQSGDHDVMRLNNAQFETPTAWETVRHDFYTWRFALDHLTRHRPRVLYIAFGETDDWAHDGRYDRVLEAFTRTDRYLQELWTWLQSQPDYRGNTSILLTTDHGRGHTPADWRDHGKNVAGAGETWMAFVSPGMSQRGEWQEHAPLTTSQIAATLVTWLGLDWKVFNPDAAGPVR